MAAASQDIQAVLDLRLSHEQVPWSLWPFQEQICKFGLRATVVAWPERGQVCTQTCLTQQTAQKLRTLLCLFSWANFDQTDAFLKGQHNLVSLDKRAATKFSNRHFFPKIQNIFRYILYEETKCEFPGTPNYGHLQVFLAGSTFFT